MCNDYLKDMNNANTVFLMPTTEKERLNIMSNFSNKSSNLNLLLEIL